MNRIKNLFAIGIFSLLILGIPALASAQNRDRDNDDDRYGNNGGYNNGGYNNGNYGDSRSAIRDLKRHAKDFQRQLDRDLDHSRYNGSRREDQMNQLADQFKDAVNDLNNNGYNNNDRYGNNNRNNNELRRVFDIASQIDRSISRSNISNNSNNIWSGIRNDLQILGYNSRRSGGWNNGGNGNGRGNNGQYNKPSWWPF